VKHPVKIAVVCLPEKPMTLVQQGALFQDSRRLEEHRAVQWCFIDELVISQEDGLQQPRSSPASTSMADLHLRYVPSGPSGSHAQARACGSVLLWDFPSCRTTGGKSGLIQCAE
jgi:hypothetical protein